MALPDNILQQVQTYQESSLAYLQNLNCFVSTANTKFKDFENLEANLGDTVTFDLPPRYTTNDSLVATFQDTEQRIQSLTVDQSKNVSYAFNTQQFVFNVKDYMDKFGKSAIAELATSVEADVASTILDHTYRFYGDGVTAIDSFKQLATMLAYFRNYGAVKDNTRGYLSDVAIPAIVDSGLSQFVLNRNNELAMSWELGSFSNCSWNQSNLLPIHTAGTVGNDDVTLVVTAVVTDADGGISAITCSGAGTDADAIKKNDLLQFEDGVVGYPDVRYRTFIGHRPSANRVQIRATADAASATDSVTIPIYPKLYSAVGRNQNVNETIVAGMELKALPTHRAGLLCSGNPLYIAVPRLPAEVPFPTANKTDPDTGVSMRMYYGSLFGQNQRGMVNDILWGKTLVDEYSMRVVFPL